MKQSKYITGILLILLALVLVGELYVWYMQGVETKYSLTTFYLQKDGTQEKMLKDLVHTSEKEGVKVFTVDRRMRSALKESITIYGTTGVRQYLAKDADVKEGELSSLFLGDSQIEFKPFQAIPDLSKVTDYYLIGDEAAKVRFKQALVGDYAGAFPREGYEMMNGPAMIAVIWLVVFSLLLLLTLYEVALLKKEVLIRLVSGENLRLFVRRKAVQDIIFYGSIFFSLLWAVQHFSNAAWHLPITLLCLGGFLFLNSASYLLLLRTDVKRDMHTKLGAHLTLRISYVYKGISMCIVMMVMAGTISLIYEGIQCYRQKSFFEAHRDYAYVSIGVEDDSRLERLINGFYRNRVQQEKTLALVELEALDSSDTYLYADRGAREYLEERMPELSWHVLKEKIYVIEPKDYKRSGNRHNEATEILQTYLHNTDEMATSTEKISYKQDVELIAFNGEGETVQSNWHRCPVILFNNLPAQEQKEIDYLIWQAAMFRLENAQWQSFVKSENLEQETAYCTSVYENYIYHWKTIRKGMIIGIVLTGLLCLLEGMILCTTLRYEYDVNAKELILKTTFGYTAREKYNKILRNILLTGGISLGVIFFFNRLFKMEAGVYLLVGGILLLVMELLFFMRYARKMEKRNIGKVLKGGGF